MRFSVLLVTALMLNCLTAYAQQPVYGVSPIRVTSSSKVTISLPKKHPKEFAVMKPDGDWVYIVDPSLHYSFFPDFINNASFTFPGHLLQGIRFDDGKQVMAKVFDQVGQYEFYFADNLETEPENTFSLSYTVRYQPN